MAFDPIPILKTDSAKEKAIKRRIDANRRGKGKPHKGKPTKRDTTQADGENKKK